jgi:glucose/mannose transport system permease protein
MATSPTSRALGAPAGKPAGAAAVAAGIFRSGGLARLTIHALLVLFCLYYLLPLYVMLVNSLKPLGEITAGGMMALPGAWTLAPWGSAWSTAQVGVEATGLRPYFINSILMVVPAVALSTILGALNGYVLTKWRFRGATVIFGLLLLGCFIPFQMVLIPMARLLGLMGLAGTVPGLIFVHLVYGIGFSTLYFRNYYAQFPTELVRAAMIDGAGFLTIFRRIMLPASGPIAVVCIIWQFTNIWNDFLFGASFSDFDSQPMTVALNNLVQSSTGVKEYNVHFAGAIMAALPTLLVYIVAGRYFVRGLMAGSVKG